MKTYDQTLTNLEEYLKNMQLHNRKVEQSKVKKNWFFNLLAR